LPDALTVHVFVSSLTANIIVITMITIIIIDVGVYKGMLERWGPDFMTKTKIGGDSCGMCVALGVALGYDWQYIGKTYIDTSDNAPGGLLDGGMVALKDHCLFPLLWGPGEIKRTDTYKTLNDRFFMGYSTFFAKHHWVTHWDSQEDLIRCCKNSLHIPFWNPRDECGRWKGQEVMDGAFIFSGADLPDGDKTLYVADDIAGDLDFGFFFSLKQCLYPSRGQDYEDMVNKGYETFMRWKGTYKRKVGVRQPNYIIQVLLWFFKIIEWIILIFQKIFCKK